MSCENTASVDPRESGLSAILDSLESLYGPQKLAGPRDPFQMLVFLYSGYPASDAACAKGFDALRRAVGVGVDEMLGATKAAIVTALRTGGIVPEERAKRLRHLAEVVRDEFDGDLAGALKAALREGAKNAEAEVRRAKKLLRQFPSVGEPGAEKILLFANLAPV